MDLPTVGLLVLVGWLLFRVPALRRPAWLLLTMTVSVTLWLMGVVLAAVPVLLGLAVVVLVLLGRHHPSSVAAALMLMDHDRR